MTDPRKPLAPLDAKLVAQLTTTLGPPEPRNFAKDGALDIAVVGAWTIGFGQTVAKSAPQSSQRGTDVEILLTAGGRLVTTRNSWTRTVDGSSEESQRSDVHETPDAAYRWLINDGNGKLGPASKAAWVQACRAFGPMAGLEFERVE